MIPGVTGATGFVGMTHIAALCQAGLRPRILVRSGHPWSKNAPGELDVVVGDLHDLEALKKFADGLTHIFHYAARASFQATEEQLHTINVQGTRNLVAAAPDDVRIVFASTQAVVLRDADILNGDESLSTNAVDFDPYGRTKALAEELVTQRTNGFVVRPPWVWGAGDTNNLPTVLKPKLRGYMRFIDHGRNRVETVHAANLVAAMHRVAIAEGLSEKDDLHTRSSACVRRVLRGRAVAAAGSYERCGGEEDCRDWSGRGVQRGRRRGQLLLEPPRGQERAPAPPQLGGRVPRAGGLRRHQACTRGL